MQTKKRGMKSSQNENSDGRRIMRSPYLMAIGDLKIQYSKFKNCTFLSYVSVMWHVQRAASDVDSFSSITKN